MSDLSLAWGGDLTLSSTAGLALVDGAALTEQRLVRRLLTNPGDYIWDLTYGAGLGRYVGSPIDVPALSALISEQAALESAVASVTSVTVTQDGLGTVSATIIYVDLAGAPQTVLVST